MSDTNFNDTTNRAVNEKDAQSMENKTVNGVTLTTAGGGGTFLANDGNYKTPAGGGNVSEFSGAVGSGNVVVFDDETGTVISDSGVKPGDFAQSGDNVSIFTNDADYQTGADVTAALVDYLEKISYSDITTDYAISSDYENLSVTATGSDVTIDLPAFGPKKSYMISVDMASDSCVIIDGVTNGSSINGFDQVTICAGDTLRIDSGGTEFVRVETFDANTIVVNSINDLPAPANVPALGYTARTIPTNTRVLFNTVIDVGTIPFYCPGNGSPLDERGISFASNRFIGGITYSGTNPLFYIEGEFSSEFMNITSPNAVVFDWRNVDASQSMIIQNGLYYNCLRLADINGALVTCSLRLVTTVNITKGVTYNSSTADQLNSTGGLYIETTEEMFDLSAATNVSDIVLASGNRFSSTSVVSSAITVGDCLELDGSMNITGNNFNGSGDAIVAPVDGANGDMVITNNIFNQGGDALSGGADTRDIRVISSGNKGLRNSRSIGSMLYDDFPDYDQIDTPLTTDSPAIVRAEFIEGSNLERWEMIENPFDAESSTLRYIGEEAFEGTAIMNIFGEESGAGSPDLDLAIYKNPVAPAVGVYTGRLDGGGFIEPSGSAANAVVISPVSAVFGDEFDIRITRLSGGNTWQTRSVTVIIQ